MNNKKKSLEKLLYYKKIFPININYNDGWQIQDWARWVCIEKNNLFLEKKPIQWQEIFFIMDNYLYEIIDYNESISFYEFKKNNDYQWVILDD